MDGKFCVECGAGISFDARFCRACGRRQPEIKIPTELAGAAVPEAAEVKPAEVAEELPKPEPRPVPDYRSYLYNGEPERVDEIPEPKSEGGIHPAYILLIGCALFIVALLVWTIFATNKLVMNRSSRESSSSRSISAAETTAPPVTAATTTAPKKGSSSEDSSTAAVYESGTYVVGRNIPEGLYIVAVDEDTLEFYREMAEEGDIYEPEFFVEVTEDDETVISDWFQNSMYVELSEGQSISSSHADIYPADGGSIKPDPFSSSGAFIVGKDVKAGTYTLVETTYAGMGRYDIYDSVESFMEGRTKPSGYSVYVDEEDEITLEDGQLVVLADCKLKK